MEDQQIFQPVPPKDITPIITGYTTLTNTSCDCQTVRILKRLLSGKQGKFTSLFTYLYQSIITNQQNQNLSNTLKAIYNQELIHANLLGNANVNINSREKEEKPVYPRRSGYSASGTVEAVGKNVKTVKVGDRVCASWSVHAQYFCVPEKQN